MKAVSYLSVCVLVLTLIGCSGQAKHSPRAGEYGKTLNHSITLDRKKVETLSTSEIKSFFQASEDTETEILFQGTAENNPYRFVAVVRGTAINQGKVNVGFMYGVRSESKVDFTPKTMMDEDDATYKAGENVLMVVASEPFSVSKNSKDSLYSVYGLLTKRENIKFESVELQVWQGTGSKFSSTRFAVFGLLIFGAVFTVYRIVRRFK